MLLISWLTLAARRDQLVDTGGALAARRGLYWRKILIK
ncbi:hypothetical protein LTSEINV_1137 [Salmonella enterica subsp. enterica serovar Inverness str. R8-3668]|uniref:Uncharacterized protein n=1 Tax=Salmonella enterica subsp. enterica serovar Inverness str. R8-3668 TaxID=913075 RepID=G5N9P9_SALET|nr:hypothetical protein LTSEINV_1137 [Salmonella enterica subsp. enterica serovar Inverness str. R8-3668]